MAMKAATRLRMGAVLGRVVTQGLARGHGAPAALGAGGGATLAARGLATSTVFVKKHEGLSDVKNFTVVRGA